MRIVHIVGKIILSLFDILTFQMANILPLPIEFDNREMTADNVLNVFGIIFRPRTHISSSQNTLLVSLVLNATSEAIDEPLLQGYMNLFVDQLLMVFVMQHGKNSFASLKKLNMIFITI